MDRIEQVFRAMQSTELRGITGSKEADQLKSGRENLNAILAGFPLSRSAKVLDFGCGIGRTSALLADYLSDGSVGGIDIVPELIAFCQKEVGPLFPNTWFRLTRTETDSAHYQHLVTNASGAVAEADFFSLHRQTFDLVVAFSVFTHLRPDAVAYYLRALRGVIKPNGRLLLTWFLDHPANPPMPIGRVPVGADFNAPSDLWFALYTLPHLERLAEVGQLWIEQVTYGVWRNWPEIALRGQNYQDVVVFRGA